MSIRSIAAMARTRTDASMQAPGAPQVWTSAASRTGAAAQEPAGTDTLLKAVPTEVIVLYTTVIGVLSGVVKDNPFDTYLPLRWGLYGGCILATCLMVPIAYHLTPTAANGGQASPTPRVKPELVGVDEKSTGTTPRKNPISETFMSAFSFAIWGLVIPGSPLYVVLRSPTLPVVVTVLSASGALVLTSIFSPWLNRAANTRTG